VLDNIIAGRYGLSRPALRAAATVGEGTYAIAVRPDEPALLAAVDAALAGMIGDGELRAILSRWQLWDERQVAVAGDAPPAPMPIGATGMTREQFLLFVRATGITVVISTLAMTLAVMGGLVLSVARRYGGAVLRLGATTYTEVFRGTPVLL